MLIFTSRTHFNATHVLNSAITKENVDWVSETSCRRCGETGNDHDEKDCAKKPKCIKCGGEHMSTSRACDLWQKEKEIVTIKYKESLSFPEARKIVKACHVLPHSYSSVIKSKKTAELKDAITQTNETPAKQQSKENSNKFTRLYRQTVSTRKKIRV